MTARRSICSSSTSQVMASGWVPSRTFGCLPIGTRRCAAIAVEAMRSKLYRHGIRNLTIFSDACRALPNEIELTELTPDGILGKGPYDAVPPILDRYNAVMDGQQAYMIPGDSQEDARCVFSTAILEALGGHRDDAFDRHLTGKVTPESLDLFLREETAGNRPTVSIEVSAGKYPRDASRSTRSTTYRSQPPRGAAPPAPVSACAALGAARPARPLPRRTSISATSLN